jgi:predicted 2-oxoglutarate/Fe(II)-dependent dioxygenase YbiX
LVGKAQQNPGQEGHTPSRNELETGALLLLPSGIISQENTTAHKATGRRACWAHGREKKIEDGAQLTRNDATRKNNRRVARRLSGIGEEAADRNYEMKSKMSNSLISLLSYIYISK